MPNTDENLKAAFAGESQANRRYLFFAKKAEDEGHLEVAHLFRAVAEAETVHARNHFRATGAILSTSENLATAIGGEHYEFTQMYPEFIKQAQADGNKKALNSFDYANQVEKIHHGMFEATLKAVGKGQAFESKKIYVCQTCGNTVEGEAPDKCPICASPRSMFKLVE